jgi:hypothetical protein
MKLPTDKFCVLPWISLETSPIGTVRPCCLAEDELCNNSGEKFNLNTAEFTAIQNSNNMLHASTTFFSRTSCTTIINNNGCNIKYYCKNRLLNQYRYQDLISSEVML